MKGCFASGVVYEITAELYRVKTNKTYNDAVNKKDAVLVSKAIKTETKVETKSTVNSFKAGDIVEILDLESGIGMAKESKLKGCIFGITEVVKYGTIWPYRINYNGKTYRFSADELKLSSRPIKTPEDLVREAKLAKESKVEQKAEIKVITLKWR